MKRLVIRLALAAAALLTAGVEGAAAQGRPGSIYSPSRGPVGAIADKRARRPGDLVTVVIAESSNVSNEETSDLKKATTLDYQLTAFDIQPSAFSPLPTLGATSQDDFQGTANYKKKGTFTARVTALVVDVLPNGNLVISGRREIRIDHELKLIEFSGTVRRFDVAADNTIESELVANALVTYVGQGPLTSSTNRSKLGGFLHSLISWIWPF